MKVTVCFGNVRVVVPCGDGEILVQDLIEKAIIRYKKATGKPSGSWVAVHNLKSLNDGGILDPDDRLNDVADDREQIVAIYEEQGTPFLHNGGDGTSASSVGTDSPDLFHTEDSKSDSHVPCHIDVENGDGIPLGISTLQVRRGSEPALNRLSPVPSVYLDPMKRWSTAVVLDDKNQNCSIPRQGRFSEPSDSDIASEREDGSGEEKSAFTRFSRDSGRLSILGYANDPYRWAEAADRQVQTDGRREPVGGPNIPIQENGHSFDGNNMQHLIILQNDGGPLGIHVLPEYDENGRDFGLVVQGIEPGGKIDKDTRISVGDRIVEINNKSLLHIAFHKAQDIFKDALKAPEIRLKLMKGSPVNTTRPPPPVYPRLETNGERGVAELDNGGFDENERFVTGRVAEVSPSKITPPVTLNRNTNAMLASNTRRIGKKYPIELTKGPNGLGFSITTRDNLAGGNCPIYIKNILPKGAAIEDGRLKPGDRLLEVNGVEMTGKTQDEAVSLLRNAPPGSTVNIVVSRQEVESPRFPRPIMGSDLYYPVVGESPYLPVPAIRPPPPEKVSDDGHIFPWKHREVLTFDIPLNDTGSAGLGVSVKGKTSTGPNGTVDLGIFVKSVIHGGAASKDGRLHENDQLIEINGVSLLGTPNSYSMETLRRVMHQEGPNPGAITLSIARRVPGQSDKSSSKHGAHSSGINGTVQLSNGVDLSSANGRNRTPTSDTSMTSTTDSDRTAFFRPYGGKLINNMEEEHNLNSANITKIEDKDLGLDCPSHMRNPIIERITGQKPPRNESFYQACHDSWNSPQFKQYINSQVPLPPPPPPPPPHITIGMASPTINVGRDDSVMIDNEYVSLVQPKGKSASRAATPDNFLSVAQPRDISSMDQPRTPAQGNPLDPNCTYTSQMSLDEDGANFARDGFGRQSMSEKRNAQLDARNTDTWQKNKKAREEKEKQKHQLDGDGQTNSASNLVRSSSADSVVSAAKAQRMSSDNVGIKKSSSLESIPKDHPAEDIYGHQPNQGGVRGRGCNESFRAAVDRSYDAPLTPGENMDTLDEESESGSSGNVGRLSARQGSLGDQSGDELGRFGKKGKKKSLLKNLGSVFKFGKNKKEPSILLKQSPNELEHYTKIDPEMIYPRKSATEDEQEKLQENSQKNTEWQKDESEEGQTRQKLPPQQQQQQLRVLPLPSHTNPLQNFQNGSLSSWPTSNGNDFPQSKQERISQLRAQHQKKHQQRLGHYPQDEKEERLQQQMQEQIERKTIRRNSLKKFEPGDAGFLAFKGGRRSCRGFTYQQRYDSEAVHSRSHSYDLYQEKPKTPVVVETKSNKYSHYMNYEEIQQHILRQQNSHPSAPPVRRERPVSNYFEYESIQNTYNPNSNNYTHSSTSSTSSKNDNGGTSARHKQSLQYANHGFIHGTSSVSNHGSFRGHNASVANNGLQSNTNQRLYEPFNKTKSLSNQRPSVQPPASKYMPGMRTRDTLAGSKV